MDAKERAEYMTTVDKLGGADGEGKVVHGTVTGRAAWNKTTAESEAEKMPVNGIIDTMQRNNGITITVNRVVTFTTPSGFECHTELAALRQMRSEALRDFWTSMVHHPVGLSDLIEICEENFDDLAKIFSLQ